MLQEHCSQKHNRSLGGGQDRWRGDSYITGCDSSCAHCPITQRSAAEFRAYSKLCRIYHFWANSYEAPLISNSLKNIITENFPCEAAGFLWKYIGVKNEQRLHAQQGHGTALPFLSLWNPVFTRFSEKQNTVAGLHRFMQVKEQSFEIWLLCYLPVLRS